MTMVWDLAIGNENPGTESMPLMYALAYINQCCSGRMGIPSSPQGRLRPEDVEPTSRGAKADVSCFSKKNDELRAKSEAICSWWEERGENRQSDGRW